MLIDTHCHIDQYIKPLQLADECEKLGITVIGMTNIPSHFELGYRHLLSYKKIRLALGMHPLYAKEYEKEMIKFIKYVDKTSYIGEIGLDFSREGIPTKEVQIKIFNSILREIKNKEKFVSLHSRKAENDVLESLIKFNIQNAVFHWYSGPLNLIDGIAKQGYYFSINPAMIKSKNGQNIIDRIPKEKLLTESDGPFIRIDNEQVTPKNIKLVHTYLASLWTMQEQDVEKLIEDNFRNATSQLRT